MMVVGSGVARWSAFVRDIICIFTTSFLSVGFSGLSVDDLASSSLDSSSNSSNVIAHIVDRFYADLRYARRALADSMEFKTQFYGHWQIREQELQAADVAIVDMNKIIANDWIDKAGAAQAYSVMGIRSLVWPAGIAQRDAVTTLERALELNPTDHLARVALGAEYCKYGLGQDTAMRFGREAENFRSFASTVLSPAAAAGQPLALLLIANIRLRQGLKEDAYVFAHSALEIAPDDSNVLDVAGQMLQSMGHKDEAEHVFALGVSKGFWPATDQRPLVFWRQLPLLPVVIPMGLYPDLDLTLHHFQRIMPAMFNDLVKVSKTLLNGAMYSKNPFPKLLDPFRDLRGGWYETKVYSCTQGGYEYCDRELMPTLCDAMAELSGHSADPPLNCSDDLATHGSPKVNSSMRFLQATISMVAPPYTHIDWHASPEHGRLRLQCPLYVPKGSKSTMRFRNDETYEYKQFDCFWFDESREHKVDYTGTDWRVSILVDTFHPALRDEKQEKVVRNGPLTRTYFADKFKRAVANAQH